MLYLDTSATAKLLLEETESKALGDFLRSAETPLVTSRVGIVELRRVGRRSGAGPDRADALAASLVVVALDETIEVTDHGRLVARLMPASDIESEIAALEARGLVVRAPSLDFASLSAPRRPRPGERPPSEILAEERSAQRF